MKKGIAILLCLAMLLGCAAAFGENARETLGEISVNGAFTLRCKLPEGYSVEQKEADGAGQLLAVISPLDEKKPVLVLSVAFDELMAEVGRLNDLDSEALKALEDSFRAEDRVEITYTETAHGTKLMVVREAHDTVDFVDFYTVYMGYGIEFVLLGNSGTLSEEEIAMAVDFLSDLEFSPVQ